MKLIVSLWISGMLWGILPREPAIYNTREGQIDLAFDLKMGYMSGQSQEISSIIDVAAQSLSLRIPIVSFNFDNPILEKQFKEVYMESETFPEAIFTGEFKRPSDFQGNGSKTSVIQGTLEMHGVTQVREIPVNLSVQDNQIQVSSEFIIKASEHNINIPLRYFVEGKDEIKVSLDITYDRIQ